ncbi:hypothetical protein CCO02nite_23240 [Cellulomonas composti]|uniref:RNA polymerase sigma factor 70 region 4 type 2 domain-containing protein n=1 Tax=Cellulomonas composti TaxID=266130 RepID=A0A511JCG0_9CELL|nr:sigma-70 family RNA polymerase sigma factor [Cellulomonas composti]GEL95666.1 hypothetical protein CCO02nite_23240 [Cellulomonas composti]
MFTIAHHRAVDEWRRRSRDLAEPVEEVEPPPVGSAEDDALDALSERRVLQVLEALTADQREVLTLRIVADLTIEQVAQVTDKNVGAVKALQRRGLAAVRRELARQGVPL